MAHTTLPVSSSLSSQQVRDNLEDTRNLDRVCIEVLDRSGGSYRLDVATAFFRHCCIGTF